MSYFKLENTEEVGKELQKDKSRFFWELPQNPLKSLQEAAQFIIRDWKGKQETKRILKDSHVFDSTQPGFTCKCDCHIKGFRGCSLCIYEPND